MLDVIEDERLVEHAKRVGALLRAAIARARGTPRSWRCAAAACSSASSCDDAGAARARGRRRCASDGVLIGRTGPRDNVLKIRPPLVFAAGHVELLVSALDRLIS